MKILASILLLFCALSASALDRITATLTVTNTPVNGNAFTVNSDTRTWKPTATNTGSQISIGASIGANLTNLYAHVAAHPFAGALSLVQSGTNAIVLTGQPGGAMAVSLVGTWGYWTLSTQAVTSLVAVRVPISGEPSATVRTNNSNGLVDGINAYASTTFETAAPALANFVNTTETQTVSNKFLTLATVDNSDLTNATIKTVKVPYVTDAESGIEFFNSSGFRTATIAPDANGIPSLYGTLLDPIPTNGFGGYTPSSENILIRIAGDTYYGRLTAANSWSGTNTFTRITNSAIVGSTISASTIGGTLSTVTGGTVTGSTLSGITLSGGTITTASGGYLNGTGLTNSLITNSTTKLKLTISGDLALTRYDHTTLASGNNAAVNFGTNAYVTITSGPSAAFTINGITGGYDGKKYWIHNASGFQMTIANQSGVDPVPENRIKTASGTDTIIGGNYWVPLIYNSGQARWILINQPIFAADLPSGINATNIANGTVSNADFEYISGMSSTGLPAAGLGNPTATIGLAAVNGTATTAIRSDGAPALDQSIAPTWTSQHKFRRTGGTQVSMEYDGSNGTTFTTGSGGELTVIPSGGEANFSGLLDASVGFKVGNAATANYFLVGDGTKYSGAPFTAAYLAFSINATNIGAGAVNSTEYGYLDGVTSAIQTQLDAKIGGSGTAGVYTKWSATATLTDSIIQEGGLYVVPRTNNVTSLGSATNRWSTVNGVIGNFSGTVTGTQLISTIASGTPPFAVSSVTDVSNLSANYLQGKDASYFWPCFATFGAGEMAYGAATTGNPTRLLGNVTTTPKYLRMVGDGVSSAAPTWSQPAFSELSGSVSIASGGTGTGTTFTQGSVVFAGASGVYSQDNANLFWDDSNNWFGIGTVTPDATLTVSKNTSGIAAPTGASAIHSVGADGAANFVTIDAYGTAVRPGMWSRLARGTAASPSAVQANDTLGVWRATGYGSTAFASGSRGGISVFASENWTDSAQGASVVFSATPKLSTAVFNAAVFASNGALEIGGTVAATDVPSAKLTVESTSEQFRTYYDPTHYASHTVNSSGNYTIAPSGGDTSITGTLTVSKVLTSTPSALTYASPTSVDVTLGNVFTVTTVNATGSVTFNATAGGTAGQRAVFIITNDATSAKTITFGTNFVPNGTLTPSGASKVATIEFLSNGTSFYEVARTVLP